MPPVARGSRLRALAQDPRMLLIVAAAGAGAWYLRRSQAAGATSGDLQGSALPLQPSGPSGPDVPDVPFDPTPTPRDPVAPDPDPILTYIGDPVPPPEPPPINQVAQGFWWGHKFWRKGQLADFEAWMKAHGPYNRDRFFSTHPNVARIFGIIPPPPAPQRPPALNVGEVGRIVHLNPDRPTLPKRGLVRRVTQLIGGTHVIVEPVPKRPRHKLVPAERRTTPVIHSNITRQETLVERTRRLVTPAGPRKVKEAIRAEPRPTPGPAAKLLERPASKKSTQPRRATTRAIAAKRPRRRVRT